MQRFLICCLLSLAALAVPATSRAVSVSANLAITVTSASTNIASVDPTNLDPNGNNLHAAAVSGAEVSRFYLTLTPFYPVASTATWSLSLAGSAVGHFSLSSASGIPVTLTTDGTRGTFTSPGTITATANSGAQFVYTLPTIVVHGSGDANTAVAACGSGSTIQTAVNSAGAGGTVVLQACTYTGQTFTPANNQRIQGAGSANTIISGTSVTGQLMNGFASSITGVTLDSLQVAGYVEVSTATCDGLPPNDASVTTGDGWVIENSYFNTPGCTGIYSNWNGTGVQILNNLVANAVHNGIYCFPGGNAGTSGPIVIKGNEVSGSNTGNFQDATAGNVKCFSVNANQSAMSVLNNYIHDAASPTADSGGADGTGLWIDTVHNTTKLIAVQGNTILNNGASGIEFEVSCNGDISHNFVKGNHGAASGYGNRGIMLRQAGPVNVYSNNVSAPATNYAYQAMAFETASRSDTCSQGINVNMYSNSITFFDTPGNYSGYPILYGVLTNGVSLSGMSICSGLASCNGGTGGPNNFHDANGTGSSRYTWAGSPTNLTTFKTNGGTRDTNSTVDTADGTTGITGCLHIACTGAGI